MIMLKLHLIDLLLYSQVYNKYSDKLNRWSLSLSVWQQHRPSKMRQTVVRRRSRWYHLQLSAVTWFLQPAEADAVLFLVCLSVWPLKIIDFMSTGPLDLFRVHFEWNHECLSVCLSVRPDVCPGLLAHLTDFVWLTITFKHYLGMLATIWTNFCQHLCPVVHMRGRTDTLLVWLGCLSGHAGQHVDQFV